MPDKSAPTDVKSDAAAPAPPIPPKRGPGHRGAEVKDTVAEMAAKAHEISLEAGSKMAAAMKDVINAAAGLTGFVLESARDLVQYMVRRGQMTQEEADKLIRQAEEAQANRPASAKPAAAKVAATDGGAPVAGDEGDEAKASAAAKKSAAKPTERAPAEKVPAEKPAAKKVATATKQPAAKKAAAPKKK